jgi:hypothetical protein
MPTLLYECCKISCNNFYLTSIQINLNKYSECRTFRLIRFYKYLSIVCFYHHFAKAKPKPIWETPLMTFPTSYFSKMRCCNSSLIPMPSSVRRIIAVLGLAVRDRVLLLYRKKLDKLGNQLVGNRTIGWRKLNSIREQVIEYAM